MHIPSIQHIIDLKIAPCKSSSDTIQQCLLRCKASQKQYLSQWNSIIWTEKEFESIANTKEWFIPHAKDLLTMHAWAIISDILRLYALYKYGGIYLDWDVELIQTIPSYMLAGNTIIGFEPYTYAGRTTVQVGTQLLISKKRQSIWRLCYQRIKQTLWTKEFNILPTLLTQVLELYFALPLLRNKYGYYYLYKFKNKRIVENNLQETIMLCPQDIMYPNTGHIPFASPQTQYTVAIHWEHSQMIKKYEKQRSWSSYLHKLRSKHDALQKL